MTGDSSSASMCIVVTSSSNCEKFARERKIARAADCAASTAVPPSSGGQSSSLLQRTDPICLSRLQKLELCCRAKDPQALCIRPLSVQPLSPHMSETQIPTFHLHPLDPEARARPGSSRPVPAVGCSRFKG